MKRIIFFAASLFATSMVCAQDYVDIAKLYYQNTPLVAYKNGQYKTHLEEYGVDITAATPLKNNNMLAMGAFYDALNINLSDGLSSVRTHNVGLKLGMITMYGNKLKATYIVLPKMASDMKSIGKEDFQLGGIAIFSYKKTANLTYKFGLYANSEKQGPFFLPLAGFYYLSGNGKLETEILLPSVVDINYNVFSTVWVGVNFSSSIRSVQLNSDYLGANKPYLSRSTNNLLGYIKLVASKNYIIFARAGYSFGRKYSLSRGNEHYDFTVAGASFGEKEVLNPEPESGMMYQVALRYRVYLGGPEKK